MIKATFFNFIRPRYFFSLVFFLVGILIIILSFHNCRQLSNQELFQPTHSSHNKADLKLQEIKAKLSSGINLDSNYEQIAKNNLFSPEREAWTPPRPDKDEDGGNSGKDSSRSRRFSHDGIRLYGTTITPSKKMALIYFEPFSDKHKYRMVQEEEIARDSGERGEEIFFQVKTIQKDKAVLEDPQGESFEVGLFDHQRSKSQPTSSERSQAKIIIGGKKDQGGSVQQGKAKQQASEQKSTTSTSQGKTPAEKDEQQEAKQDQNASKKQGQESDQEKSKNPFKSLLEKLSGRDAGSGSSSQESQEDKEKMVEEGKMQKIETPFGTVYRPKD